MHRLLVLFVFSFCKFAVLRGQEEPEKTSNENYKVVFFISPTCKICQYYSLPFREFYNNYNMRGFEFEALVPGTIFTDEDIQDFAGKYRIPFPVHQDTALMHLKWNATITPEVFVIDLYGNVIYNGRIDDSYAVIGKRRRVVKNHELQNVLDALSNGEKVPHKFVPAVGCLIEKEKN